MPVRTRVQLPDSALLVHRPKLHSHSVCGAMGSFVPGMPGPPSRQRRVVGHARAVECVLGNAGLRARSCGPAGTAAQLRLPGVHECAHKASARPGQGVFSPRGGLEVVAERRAVH